MKIIEHGAPALWLHLSSAESVVVVAVVEAASSAVSRSALVRLLQSYSSIPGTSGTVVTVVVATVWRKVRVVITPYNASIELYRGRGGGGGEIVVSVADVVQKLGNYRH